jgi:hypothetical protein
MKIAGGGNRQAAVSSLGVIGGFQRPPLVGVPSLLQREPGYAGGEKSWDWEGAAGCK